MYGPIDMDICIHILLIFLFTCLHKYVCIYVYNPSFYPPQPPRSLVLSFSASLSPLSSLSLTHQSTFFFFLKGHENEQQHV